MKDFTRITEFSYDYSNIIELLCFIALFILFLIFGIIAIRKFIIEHDKFMVIVTCVMLFLFALGQFIFLYDISSQCFKQHAIYEGQFKVVQSNTNEIYAYDNNDYQKRIKVKDKDNNIQIFDIDNNTQIHKGEIVKIKARVYKGYKPSLKKELPEYRGFNSFIRSNQNLLSIEKVK